MVRASTSFLVVLVTAFLLTSCGTSFNKPWHAAVAKPVPTNSIEGPWLGFWKSAASGHSGALRCIVGPAQGGSREFYYHATWGGVFRAGFQTLHEVKETAGTTAFTAKRSIERHGFFQAECKITPTESNATYRAAGDHGVFELRRPK